MMLTIFSIMTRCLGFIFKIYLTKIMTTTELGIYNLTLSVYMVLLTIVGASIPLTISKITASNIAKNNSNETKYSITSSLILTTLVSIFLSILVLISKPLIVLIIGDSIGYEIMLTLIPSIIFTAIYSQIRGYLWGLENYFAVSIVEFVEQILRIAFCIVFVNAKIVSSPILGVGISLSIACGLSLIYGLILYFKNGGKFKYKKGYYKNIIQSTIPLTAVRLFGSILQPIIAIIIPWRLCSLGMSKDLALGELGIAMGMTLPLLSIPSTIIGAMCMILIPRINSSTDVDEQKYQINNYLKFTITSIFVFIPIFLTLSIPLCNYVYNNYNAGLYMTECSWIIIPMGLAQISTSILNALSKENKTFIFYVISCILMIILVLILPNIFYVKAMMIASGISYILLTLLNIIYLKKILKLKTALIKNLIFHALICVPVVIFNNFCYNIFISNLSLFLSIIFTGLISAITYLALLFVFGILDINIIKTYVIKTINKRLKKSN